VAESCTGGLISHLLTNVPGSSDFFRFGGVTYANAAKQVVLDVSAETIANFGAVSEPVVREMAEGVRRSARADFGLATSGIAGPSGGTPEKPIGTLCLAVASKAGMVSRTLQSPFKERLSNKQVFAISALNMLRKELLKKGE
jgi:nicotinamide-nucleotide amidase